MNKTKEKLKELLIHKKTSPKISITAVRATIAAIRVFERQIERAIAQNQD